MYLENSRIDSLTKATISNKSTSKSTQTVSKPRIKYRTRSLPDNVDEEVADGIGGSLEEVPAAASISPMLFAKAVASGSGSLSSDLSLSLPLPAPRRLDDL